MTLAEKLALIYTSAGSMRSVAGLVGISHQKISRILHGQSSAKVLADPGLRAAVEVAFSIHKDLARDQARADGLPFDPAHPVFYERLKFKDGTPGDRVGALHTHWLTDAQRDAWLTSLHRSNRFYTVSVQSIVNLVVYNKRAEVREKRRDRHQIYDRSTIQKKIQQQIVTGPIYTSYTGLTTDGGFTIHESLQSIHDKLRTRHEPATGDNGTALSTAVLLQVDTRHGKDKRFRDKHPLAAPKRERSRRSNPAKRSEETRSERGFRRTARRHSL